MLGRLIKGAIIAAIAVMIWKYPDTAAQKGISFVSAGFTFLGGGWDAFMRFVEGL